MIPLMDMITILAQAEAEKSSNMNPITDVLTYVAGATISTAFVVAFIRLLIGPEVPDRVVALDLMATVAVGAIALLAVRMNNYIFLDAAMVLALIFFLGTIAFAYYLEKKGDTA
jgi:multicomponent Na+:H+ antiporter subunit F